MPDLAQLLIEYLPLYLFLFALGWLLYLVGVIWCSVDAFRINFLYGLGVLLIPLVQLFFAFYNWSRSRQPILVMLLGVAVVAGTAFQGARKVEAQLTINIERSLAESCQELVDCRLAVRNHFKRCFERYYIVQDHFTDYLLSKDVKDYAVLSSRCVTDQAREAGMISASQKDPENLTHENFRNLFDDTIQPPAEVKVVTAEPETTVIPGKVEPVEETEIATKPDSQELLANLKNYKGYYVNVKTDDRYYQRVYITDVMEKSIIVNKYYGSGFINYNIKRWKIEHIELY